MQETERPTRIGLQSGIQEDSQADKKTVIQTRRLSGRQEYSHADKKTVLKTRIKLSAQKDSQADKKTVRQMD